MSSTPAENMIWSIRM